MCRVDLKNDKLRMLGAHFSYNVKLKRKKKKKKRIKKLLHSCNKYSTSTENMGNENSYTH